MSAPKFTPGPWGYEDGFEIAPIDQEGKCDWAREICMTACAGEEQEANAKLICAAPELFMAAMAMIGANDAVPGDDLGQLALADAWGMLRAAVKKAGWEP